MKSKMGSRMSCFSKQGGGVGLKGMSKKKKTMV
jgi:hypothetical protein